MYAEDPKGPYVLKNGRMLRGKGKKTYRLVGREGIDNDGDGRYSEDPPGGVDLNRNFPQGFKARRSFEGFRGPKPLSEPETKAVVDFVTAKRNISYFFDYHNAAKTFFYWVDPAALKDRQLFDELASRVEQSLDYAPKALTHDGVGLSIAWAYGRLGLFAGIVELEAQRGDAKSYLEEAWEGKAFIAPKPFEHPTLGPILIGNDYRKLVKRNPHPKDIPWLAERNFSWLRKEMGNLPKLEILEPCITKVEDGLRVTGIIHNKGALPTDSEKAIERARAWPVRVVAKGAELVGVQEFGTLGPKEKKAFALHLKNPGEDVELVFSHPRAGMVELTVRKPRSRTIAIRRKYEILEGYATPDKAVLADNEYFKQGKSQVGEKGPAFKLTHDKKKLRIAVLLAEWRDRRHVWSRKTFEQLFFAKEGYRKETAVGQALYGSVRDFYREMSFGALEIEGRVFDWVELPGHYAEYRDASFGSPIVSDRMLAAVKARFGMDSLEGYDGYVFVWAGNAVRRTSALWPMRIKPKQLPGKVAFKMGELHHGELTPIGVPCHEMGHCFGVSDKYGLGATPFPLGPWCLMGKGTHGAPPSGRHRPFHLCAWCKMVIGWLEPAVIDASKEQSLALRPITYDKGECFKILLKPDGSEYLLLENRRREGAFTDLPSAGLVVLKVGPNDRPAYPQTRVQLLPAHGKAAVRRGIVPQQQRVAWPQKGKTCLVMGRVVLSELRIVDDVLYFKAGPVR